MKEMDVVRITVEKSKYAQEGVHKGMYGWICDEKNIDSSWLVNFPQCGENNDIATISIHEDDMEIVPIMCAVENERIKAEFGD